GPVTQWTDYLLNLTKNEILLGYPRPQMKRQKWTNLYVLWSFPMTYRNMTIKNRTINLKIIFNETIRVPFPVESYLSGIHRRVLPAHYLRYQRRLQISRDRLGKFNRLLLHFDSVDYETYVWINRIFVGKHRGGYQPFHFDITEYLQTAIRDRFNYYQQELIVRVWDPTDKSYQSRGKQVLNSSTNSIYYTPISGIWQTVWLESVPLVYISKLWFQSTIDHKNMSILHHRIDINIKNRKLEKFITYIPPSFIIDLSYNEFDDSSSSLNQLLDVERKNPEKKDSTVFRSSVKILKTTRYVIKLTLKLDKNIIIEKSNIVPNVEQKIVFDKNIIKLWSPESPNLYDITIDLYEHTPITTTKVFKNIARRGWPYLNKIVSSTNNYPKLKNLDKVDSYIGFRSINLCGNSIKEICLNNEKYFMLGVLDQGYWPDGLYRAPTDSALKYDIFKMKSLGFNTIRKHMKIESSRWYYWCDVMGMLVWQDMPASDSYYGYEVELIEDERLRIIRDNVTNNIKFDYLSNPSRNLTFIQFSQINNSLIFTPESIVGRQTGSQRSLKSKLQFEYELKSMIDTLYNHPSIVMWVLFNEEWGQYDTLRLGQWLKYYSGEYRLINAVSGWQDRSVGDIRDIHDYTAQIELPSENTYDRTNRALVLGECGGYGLLVSRNHTWKFHDSEGWSYAKFKDKYLMTYGFERLMMQINSLKHHSYLSSMIYTQLSDVEYELNGMLTYDRKVSKYVQNHIRNALKFNFTSIYHMHIVFSGIYNDTLWNYSYDDMNSKTQIKTSPFKSFTNIWITRKFKLDPSVFTTYKHHYYYLYMSYSFCYVNITIDNRYKIDLNESSNNYAFIPLSDTIQNVFKSNLNRTYTIDVHASYYLGNIRSIRYRDADDLTALSIAAGKKHKSITEILANCEEVDVNKPSSSGITPLLMVAEVGWPDILQILLKRGAIVDAAPSGPKAELNKIAGSTPLIGATKYDHPDCVKILLQNKANANHQNQSGISALMLAAEQGYFECVKLLVEFGANLELAPSGQIALNMNLCGQTPLFCAAKEGRQEIVKYLIDQKANPRVQNHYGVSALWIPAQKGMLDVVELLLNAGANTEIAPFGNLADDLNITGWTPLYAAMKARKFDVVQLLLSKRANPNAVTKLGSTPFLLASEICDLEIIAACVEAGADLDFAPSGRDADNLNITGQTALFMATLKERSDVVKYLISKGAKVDVKNRYGVSPLLLCAEGGNKELVQVLVQAGANVNITPTGDLAEENFLAGQTPLSGAAKKGHTEICEYLIKNGANVNAVTM
ncbi:unnamed protein product, partial [Didymodactylos carnosus]